MKHFYKQFSKTRQKLYEQKCIGEFLIYKQEDGNE